VSKGKKSIEGNFMKRFALAIVGATLMSGTAAYAKDIQKAVFAGGCFGVSNLIMKKSKVSKKQSQDILVAPRKRLPIKK
jgi:hypothetical protein